ncbi:MAG TPA: POTRA domain-containing protein, partial [Thermoanaerobaculia bacterium]|nr:POTRA domain-containing protein [Thermoanaerobaculia bacterium]
MIRNRTGRAWATLFLLLLPFTPPFAGMARADERVRIEVEGIDGDLRRNVIASLSLEEAREDGDLTEERIRRLHARAGEEIAEALQPFGHYRPDVQATLSQDGETWVARYQVDPGPPLKVTALDVRAEGAGAQDPWFRRDVQEFPLRQGETLYHPDYEAGKQRFVDDAAENGYLDGDFQQNEIRVDLEAYTANVALLFATGPRYLFGPVVFNQDFLDPDLLRGYVTFERGEPLNLDEVLEMQSTLSDSPYFERVEVLTRRDQAEGLQVPIEVNLTPSKPQRWSAGAGYGTDTGPRGTAALELRRINRQGHRAQVEVRGSEIEQSFRSQYEIPGAYPRTDV